MCGGPLTPEPPVAEPVPAPKVPAVAGPEEPPVRPGPAKAAPEEKPASCNSFAGVTGVLMGDGSTKPIDQVKVGDTVSNSVPDGGTVGQHTVTAVHVTTSDRSFGDVTFTTPSGPKTITSTAQHLFWDATLHTWREADNLRVGDEVDTPGDGHVTVVATHLYAAAIITYNLTIDGVHTYYVEAGTEPGAQKCGP